MNKRLFPLVGLVLTAATFVTPAPVLATPEKVSVSSFANCARLTKVFPRGVAVSRSKASLQRIRPTVNRLVYLKNVKLDRDKDGTACESSGSGSPSTSVVKSPSTSVVKSPSTSVGTGTTLTCPTGTWRFELTGLDVTLVLPTTYSGVSNYYFTVSGVFTNSTNAIVFPNSMFARVAFTPNLSNANRIPKNSPTEVNLLLDGPRFEVKPGASETVSGTGFLESLAVPSLAGSEVQVMWNDPKYVAFCSAPPKR